jgi:hypothetical protein
LHFKFSRVSASPSTHRITDCTACRPKKISTCKLTGQMKPSGLLDGVPAELALRTGFSRQSRQFWEQSFRLRR